MSNFYFPKRFDSTQADEGVWTSVIDEMDNLWLRAKLCLFDENTQRYRITMERLQRKYPRGRNGQPNAKLKEMSADALAIELFVEMSFVDWELKDAKGKLIPFSKEAAVEYLSQPEALFALSALGAFARDVRNFQPEEQEELPEGN